MAIVVKCPNPACGKEYDLKAEFAGKTVKCNSCQQVFTVPGAPPSVYARGASASGGQSAMRSPAVPPKPGTPDAKLDPLIGSKIAHYRIQSLLGQGGMGKVYKAHNTSLDKTCAIKILPREFVEQDQSSIDRFVREARSAAKVEHPNALPVFFVGKVEGRYFIEMQYVDGGTLQGLLKETGRIEIKAAARIIRDVAAGLAAAHKKGIIHRDIKPTNVMLTHEGHVYVMDFGLAKMAEARTGLTQQGTILGTPLYMSPEQAMGQPVDHRSDIYSLGVMFYQIVTGTPPYTADSPVALLYQHQHAPIPDITQVAPETPPVIAATIRKMMAKEPKDRYQSCAEVVDELNGFLTTGGATVTVSDAALQGAPDHRRDALARAKRGAPSRVAPPSAAGAAPKKRSAAPAVLALALLLVLAIGAGAYFVVKKKGSGFGAPNGLAHPPRAEVQGSVTTTTESAQGRVAQPPPAVPSEQMVKSPWDDAYVATAATGEKIPHPLWRKTNAITIEGQTVAVPEGMAYVPGGRFILGENKEESARPAHIVDLKPFFLEKFEVTNAQYMEFIKATGHAPPRYIKENEGRIPDGRQNHPVTCVRWDDAKAYCDWSGKRLPTEAEWEMAASWDPEKKVKFTYPWGDEPLDRQNVQGNYCFNWPNGDHGLGAGWPDWIKELRTTPATKDMMKAGGLTKAVGSYARGRSPFMCFDMGGNVAEWTADLFALYPGNNNLSERDKLLIAKQAHVQRGGSWRTGAQACSMRYGQAGVGSVPECSGFRCAADYPWKAPDGGGR